MGRAADLFVPLPFDGAVADVGAVLHAIEVDLLGRAVGRALRCLDGIRQPHHAQDTAARGQRTRRSLQRERARRRERQPWP